ncbi:MAG: RNA polymerase sigma factor [Candidatus Aminicenantes bacterium]|nr:RNA polymerase sigma factor [Candidatus Aminicenantes bacterium]
MLLKKLQNGNSEALQIIYEKYKTDMLAVALAMAADRPMAEDVVHDVFVSFAGAARSLEIRRSLKSYLLTSIVNRIRNIFKAGGRAAVSVAPKETEDPRSFLPDLPSTSPTDLDRLNRAMDALPEAQRYVIILHLLEGLRFRAIAESQGESLHTVQSRYRYGMHKLRSFLAEGNEHV